MSGSGTRPRSTRQRTAIVAVLSDADGFRSAQEIHAHLRDHGQRVGLTTVYRTLQSLVEADVVDLVRSDDGEAWYRLCTTDEHHHHLVCRSCGTSVEVASDEVERWAAGTAERHGFTAVTHTAELYGLCAVCSRAP